MRIGIVFIVAGVLLLVATLPNSIWLSRGQQRQSVSGTMIDNILVSGTKSSTTEYELAEINTLVLETFSGDIEVETSQTMSTLGEFEIMERANDSRGIQQKTPVLERQDNVLSLRATQSCPDCSISYRVKLGKAMRLELRASNGDITVQGLSNNIKAVSNNGNINISDTGKTTLDLEGSNGNITLSDVELMAGSQNKIRSSNGEVVLRLENTSGVRLSGSTQNAWFIADREDLKMESENGSFVATLAGINPAQLEISSQNGDIRLEQP